MYRSLNSLFIRFSWNYWKNENKYKLEKERIGYCYKYREWHVCSINWRYVSINMKTTRHITLIFKLRSTFFVLNRLKKILETSFTCIFSCKNQPTQLKILKPSQVHSRGSFGVPKSKFEANRSRGSWAMIEYANMTTKKLLLWAPSFFGTPGILYVQSLKEI